MSACATSPRAATSLEVALEVGAALSASLDLEEVLSTIARRLTEVFDVWECNICEYRP